MKNHSLLPVEDETIDDTLHSSKHPETATKRKKNYKNYIDTVWSPIRQLQQPWVKCKFQLNRSTVI